MVKRHGQVYRLYLPVELHRRAMEEKARSDIPLSVMLKLGLERYLEDRLEKRTRLEETDD